MCWTLSERLGGTHDTAAQGRWKLGRTVYEQYMSAAFVRNPWDRLVSWYSMIERSDRDLRLHQYVHENSHDFDSFVRNCTRTIHDHDGKKSFCRNQIDYLTDWRCRLIVDFVGRFETIEQDARLLFRRWGWKMLTFPMPDPASTITTALITPTSLLPSWRVVFVVTSTRLAMSLNASLGRGTDREQSIVLRSRKMLLRFRGEPRHHRDTDGLLPGGGADCGQPHQRRSVCRTSVAVGDRCPASCLCGMPALPVEGTGSPPESPTPTAVDRSLNPSRYEGMPMVTLEAMLWERPVSVTVTGGRWAKRQSAGSQSGTPIALWMPSSTN